MDDSLRGYILASAPTEGSIDTLLPDDAHIIRSLTEPDETKAEAS